MKTHMKKQHFAKRVMALVLVLALALGMFPAQLLADGAGKIEFHVNYEKLNLKTKKTFNLQATGRVNAFKGTPSHTLPKAIENDIIG